MTRVPGEQCVRLTIGFTCDTQRYQWVAGYGTESVFTIAELIADDFDEFVSPEIFDLWKLIAAEDCQMKGWLLEGLVPATPVIPRRGNFADGTKEGTIVGDSGPPQSSMLVDFYSNEQAGLDQVLRTGKTFVGPCPESKTDSGVISDGGQRAALNALAVQMMGFIGVASGHTWARVVCPASGIPNEFYLADQATHRDVLFTQKRRMYPLF